MARRIVLLILLTFGLGLGGSAFEPAAAQFFFFQQSPQQAPPPAQAPRQQGGFNSFFDRLFGPVAPGPQAPPKPSRRIRTAPAAPAEPPVQTVPVAEKDPQAHKILVIGDFVAGGLAWGLDQTFAEEPKLAVVDESNGSSGLVRAGYFDWNAKLPELLNSVQPDMIVITIGANDRQPISDNGQSYQPRSNEWESLYGKRVDALLETLKVFGRPFFWVSAPPMRNGSLSDHMLYVNGLVKPRVEAAGGHFIDIWDGFANKDGHFVGSGPDVDGQVRQLRNRDGINFTRAGRLKLAFYVAREIRRQTGLGAGTVDLLPAVSQTGHIEIGPDGKKRLVGPVISLNDPLPGASDALAGGAETEPAKTPEESLQYRLVVKGEALPTTPGRVDDFAWPRSAREVSSTGTDGGAGLLPVPRPARGPVLKPVSK